MRPFVFPLTLCMLTTAPVSVFADWTQVDYDAYENAVATVTSSYGSTNPAVQLAIREDLWNTLDHATYVSHTWESGAKAGQTENLVKVLTWAWNYDSWTAERGTEWTLSSYNVFPWVTLGGTDDFSTLGEMQSFFRQNYSGLGDEIAVYDKVWHALGMSQSTKENQTRVLVKFLVSVDDLIRPAYSWDPRQTPASGDFQKTPEGAFIAEEVQGLTHDLTVESNIDYSTQTISNANPASMQDYLDANMFPPEGESVHFPFTGMGYTYNTDPDAGSHIGLSEFLVNGDAAVVNWNIIGDTAGELYAYLIPEPGTYALFLGGFALGLIFLSRRTRRSY